MQTELELREALARDIDSLADQLSQAADGNFDFRVHTDSADARVQKLGTLVNIVVESARRAIAELKQEHRRLQESEQRHRDYIANTPLGVFVTDERGRYVQVNPAACRMTGYAEHELLAMRIPDLLGREGIAAGMRYSRLSPRQARRMTSSVSAPRAASCAGGPSPP